jgi:hypothetical protein
VLTNTEKSAPLRWKIKEKRWRLIMWVCHWTCPWSTKWTLTKFDWKFFLPLYFCFSCALWTFFIEHAPIQVSDSNRVPLHTCILCGMDVWTQAHTHTHTHTHTKPSRFDQKLKTIKNFKILKKKKKRKLLATMRLALHVWCLHTPPPRMIMPVLTEYMAWLFNRRRSATSSVQFNSIEILFYNINASIQFNSNGILFHCQRFNSIQLKFLSTTSTL